ncbi:GNAT family N-acetyltransferase [Paenibacillus xanthanilyticus]|uniref:GNAT family N-acetyltransferase n=1 Tax=Paenibacillus xanthanilyticus TaxID=1783531 RepID=A0ABV8K528_9BACL
MEYIRIQSLQDPLFASMHNLMKVIFPPEEVLAFDKWEGPLQDESIHVYVAVHEGEVVGATEYRYYPDMRVAMTDFTIIGKAGLGIGRFLLRGRERDIARLAAASGTEPIGMFAEIYNPSQVEEKFTGLSPMNPYVRREVLSHIGYKRIDFPYVHPSWEENGEAVSGLDLSFLPTDEERSELPASLIRQFLNTYYSALPAKPDEWHAMMAKLGEVEQLPLRPL